MTEEMMKEICRSYSYGFSMEKIVEIEEVTMDQVKEAINWGYDTQYFKELKERKE